MNQVFRLVHDTARRGAAELCRQAPDGTVVTFSEELKTREQEEKYHAMIDDITAQCVFLDRHWTRKDWKVLLLDAFARIKQNEGKPLAGGRGQLIRNLDNTGFVALGGVQSRHLRKSEALEFIEYLACFGAEQKPQVEWKNERPY
jgi:hypothetical protein